MIFKSKFTLVKLAFKAFLISVMSILLLQPMVGNAQYGGGTITPGANTSLKYTSNQASNSATINISSGKKGDIINVAFNNSINNILSIRFTLGSDVSNAVILLSQIQNSELSSGLNGNPISGYSLTLSNISYEQLVNFSFDFIINNNNVTREYLAYSSNSPWISASLTQPVAINSGTNLKFTGSTAIAFKQFALTSASNQGSVLGEKDELNSNLDSGNQNELVRTGQIGYNNIVLLLLSVSFVISTYLVLRVNAR